MNNKKPSLLRSLGIALGVVLVIVVFAYGVKVTDVNFETTRSVDRLTSLKRVIRALARPDIIEYDYDITVVEIPFYLPCPEGEEISTPDLDQSQPYILASAYCASPQEIVHITGKNFPPDTKGPVDFYTTSGVKKPLGNFSSDSKGEFQLDVELPTRQPIAEAQKIIATIRNKVGSPMLTDTAKVTWDKILETVFMALLATTIGTALAIPVSFIAARNLMAENNSPLTSIAFSIVGWPIGIYLGLKTSVFARQLLIPYLESPGKAAIGLMICIVLVIVILQWVLKADDKEPGFDIMDIIKILAYVAAGLAGIAVMLFIETLSRSIGLALIEPLGPFGFIGNFLYQMGEAATLIIPVFVALGLGAVVGGTLGKIGQNISDKSPYDVVRMVNIIGTTVAGASLFALIGTGINWLYQIDNLSKTLYWPAGIGAIIGLVLALIVKPKQPLPTGMIIYFITRTILNGTRSVEALVMAIVFVIWVGIGPFAGSLALALHTVAALAKLYSEQVESILPGPLEAVQATGANRLQTIVYAIVPQIVSPYISFTMYRWDINVRMSTIIGFVGGGGIGFLLSQNINLLDYRAASAQMLAIAVVVASMDYISSVIREKFV
ncbi:MAG: ABC transporter permease subunit [Anaerolineales bacterium]|nr:ABC transporter permease subunit [Anaerolineales bacterium]